MNSLKLYEIIKAMVPKIKLSFFLKLSYIYPFFTKFL